MLQTPEGCEPHQVAFNADYKPHAWENYTLTELGWWVHLSVKRAEHRSNPEKCAKDLHDAENYLSMMQAKLEEARLQIYHALSLEACKADHDALKAAERKSS